jgi:tRNA threonylcarbamoyladenosine biosynthesis protein TsaE
MDISTIRITKNAEETKRFGAELANFFIKYQSSTSAIVICLYGELGSGKTTCVQGMLEGFGLEGRFLSPTFVITRQYDAKRIQKNVYHMDCYRLNSEADIEAIGFQELVGDKANIVIVEWAERLGNVLPKNRMDIYFETKDDSNHKIQVKYDSYGCTH